MPRLGKIVRQYSRHQAFAFDLYTAHLRIERASDRTIIKSDPVALGGLTRAATACANQGAQKKRGNVNPFHRRYISPKVSVRVTRVVRRPRLRIYVAALRLTEWFCRARSAATENADRSVALQGEGRRERR